MFIMIISTISFICIREGSAQTLSENENMQIKQALSQLPKGTFGYIIWMSNREGNWNIYRMEIPTGSMKKLTHNDTNNRKAKSNNLFIKVMTLCLTHILGLTRIMDIPIFQNYQKKWTT
jgi:hypothetical protein